MSEPSVDTITSFLTDYVATADLQTVTIKFIREVLRSSLGAEPGQHYQKEWLKTEVDKMCLARMQMEAEQASAEHEEPAAGDAADAEAEPMDEEAADDDA